MQAKKHQMDYILFFTVLIICAVGVLTVFSASTVIDLQHQPALPAAFYAQKQFMWAVAGILLLTIVSQISYRLWYAWSVPILLINLFLLLLVLVPGIGKQHGGGQRWLGTTSVYIQPSELAIITSCIYLAYFFTKKVMINQDFKRGVIPAIIVIGLNFVLIMAEPDMGTGLTLLGTSLVIVFASGARIRPLIIGIGALLPVLIALALSSYRSARITAWLHPFAHQKGIAYQLIQGMTAISAGGWFGRGYGNSLEKAGYLPYPQTDFIFPVFVEEWGLVGAVALLIALGVVIWRGFRIARRSQDRFGALLAVGLTSMITIKSFINLGAVTGLLPVTGIPLPFISYGGTSLVMNLVAMGIVLSISKYSLAVEPEEFELAEIIDSEDVRASRETRATEDFPRRAFTSRAKSAKVQELRPSRDVRQNARTGNWRANQEAAATKQNSVQKRSTSTSSTSSWRARHEQAERWRTSGLDPKPTSKRKFFKKDR